MSGGDPDADPVAVAREIALRLLTVRSRSRAELHAELGRRHVSESVCGEVLDRLTEVGLIDDEKFAESWVSAQGRRLTSTRVMRQQLRTKGVEQEIIADAVDAVADGADEAAARSLVAKRLPSMRGLPAQTRYRRLTGLLARRGFPSSIIVQVVRESEGPDQGGDADSL